MELSRKERIKQLLIAVLSGLVISSRRKLQGIILTGILYKLVKDQPKASLPFWCRAPVSKLLSFAKKEPVQEMFASESMNSEM